jgi:hypothetical protein
MHLQRKQHQLYKEWSTQFSEAKRRSKDDDNENYTSNYDKYDSIDDDYIDDDYIDDDGNDMDDIVIDDVDDEMEYVQIDPKVLCLVEKLVQYVINFLEINVAKCVPSIHRCVTYVNLLIVTVNGNLNG